MIDRKIAHVASAAFYCMLFAGPALGSEPLSPDALRQEPLSPGALRQAIHHTLRAEATSQGATRETHIKRLVELHDAIRANQQLADRSKRQLTALLRARLRRIEAELRHSLPAESDASAASHRSSKGTPASTQSPKAQAINAQVAGNLQAAQPVAARQAGNIGPAANQRTTPNPGANLAAQTSANAQELIELIQNSIAPSTWDVRGGLGTIRYFAPKQVLVIRQTDDIHDQVGDAIGQLRGQRAAP